MGGLATGHVTQVQSNDLTGWLEGELVKASPGRHRAGWFPSTFVVLCTKTGEPIDANAAEPKRRPRKEPNYPVIDTHHGSLASIGVPFHAVETLEEAKEVWEATRTVDPDVARVAVTEPRPDEVDNPCVELMGWLTPARPSMRECARTSCLTRRTLD